MVIDTSALAAILFEEAEGTAFDERIALAPRRLLSAASLFEASIVVESRKGKIGGMDLDLLVHRLRIDVVPLTEEHVELARSAWRRYGKGNHPAGLNMGDCYAYALARHSGEPLLYKGDDFAKTDILSAATSAR